MTVFYSEERKKWTYNFRIDGKRYSTNCIHPDTGKEAKSEKQARDIEALIRDRIKRTTSAPTTYGCSLAETAAWHIENHAQHLASWPTVRGFIRELLDYFGKGTDINSITDEDIAHYTNWSRQQTRKVWMKGPKKREYDPKLLKFTGSKTRSPVTINQYLKVLRQLYNTPIAKKHCSHPPTIKLLKEPKRTPTPIDQPSVESLLKHAPPHLQKIMILCIHTGMREKEALRLKTGQFIEDQKLIYLDATTKARKGREVFVNEMALGILKECRAMGDELWAQLQENKKLASEYAQEYGIRTRGDIPFLLYPQPLPDEKHILRPINSIKSAWISAREKAGLTGKVRFHDTRASFCSYLAQLGVNLLDIKQLAGHESVQTTMRYINSGNTNLRNAVDMLAEKRPLQIPSAIPQSQEKNQDHHKSL